MAVHRTTTDSMQQQEPSSNPGYSTHLGEDPYNQHAIDDPNYGPDAPHYLPSPIYQYDHRQQSWTNTNRGRRGSDQLEHFFMGNPQGNITPPPRDRKKRSFLHDLWNTYQLGIREESITSGIIGGNTSEIERLHNELWMANDPLYTEQPDNWAATKLLKNLVTGGVHYAGSHWDILALMAFVPPARIATAVGSLFKFAGKSKAAESVTSFLLEGILGLYTGRGFFKDSLKSRRLAPIAGTVFMAAAAGGAAELVYSGVSRGVRSIRGEPQKYGGNFDDFFEGVMNGLTGVAVHGALVGGHRLYKYGRGAYGRGKESFHWGEDPQKTRRGQDQQPTPTKGQLGSGEGQEGGGGGRPPPSDTRGPHGSPVGTTPEVPRPGQGVHPDASFATRVNYTLSGDPRASLPPGWRDRVSENKSRTDEARYESITEADATSDPFAILESRETFEGELKSEARVASILRSYADKTTLSDTGDLYFDGVLWAPARSGWAEVALKYREEMGFRTHKASEIGQESPSVSDLFFSLNRLISAPEGSAALKRYEKYFTLIDPETRSRILDPALTDLRVRRQFSEDYLNKKKDDESTGNPSGRPVGERTADRTSDKESLEEGYDDITKEQIDDVLKDHFLRHGLDTTISPALKSVGKMFGVNVEPGNVREVAAKLLRELRLTAADTEAFDALRDARGVSSVQQITIMERLFKDSESQYAINNHLERLAVNTEDTSKALIRSLVMPMAKLQHYGFDKLRSDLSLDSGVSKRVVEAIITGDRSSLQDQFERDSTSSIQELSDVLYNTQVVMGVDLGLLDGYLSLQHADAQVMVARDIDPDQFVKLNMNRLDWNKTARSHARDATVKKLIEHKDKAQKIKTAAGNIDEGIVRAISGFPFDFVSEYNIARAKFFTTEGRESYLGGVYQQLINGEDINEVALRDRHVENLATGSSRILHFKDASSALIYAQETSGHDNLYQLLVSNVERIAAKLGQLDTLGPHPSRQALAIVKLAEQHKEGKPKVTSKDSDLMGKLHDSLTFTTTGSYSLLSAGGVLLHPTRKPVFETVTNFTRFNAINKIGKIAKYILDDGARTALTGKHLQLTLREILENYLTPDGDIMGSEVAHMRVVMEGIRNLFDLSSTVVERDVTYGPLNSSNLRKHAAFMLTHSGGDYTTKLMKSVAEKNFMRAVGENIDTDWELLSDELRGMLSYSGINGKVWNVLQSYTNDFLIEVNSAKYYSAHDARSYSHKPEVYRALTRYNAAMLHSVMVSVPESSPSLKAGFSWAASSFNRPPGGGKGKGGGKRGGGAPPFASGGAQDFFNQSLGIFTGPTMFASHAYRSHKGVYGPFGAAISIGIIVGFCIMISHLLMEGEAPDIEAYTAEDWFTMGLRSAKAGGGFGIGGDVALSMLLALSESSGGNQVGQNLMRELENLGHGPGIGMGLSALGDSAQLLDNAVHSKWRQNVDVLSKYKPNLPGTDLLLHRIILNSVDDAVQEDNFISPYERRTSYRQNKSRTMSLVDVNKVHQMEYNRRATKCTGAGSLEALNSCLRKLNAEYKSKNKKVRYFER